MATSPARAKPLRAALPAAIAYDLQHVPETTVLALLGMGVIESNGRDTDDRVAAAYAMLADEVDPAKVVRKYYRDLGAQHGWLGKHMKVLLDPIKRPAPSAMEALREAAIYFSTMSLSRLEELADADLLGRVDMEMVHQRHKRRGTPGTYAPLDDGQLRAAMGHLFGEYRLREGMRFHDQWAGSGFRAIGLATHMRSIGLNPQTVHWRLDEADALHRAIIAINCLAFEIGEDIEICDGTAHRAAALAAYARGEAPGSWFIPKEVATGRWREP